MTWRIIVEPRARLDVLEQVARIASDNPAAARRFTDASDLAYRRIADAPEAGASRRFRSPRLKGLRMRLVPGFEQHLIFYRLVDDEIHIVRVIHGARDLPNAL